MEDNSIVLTREVVLTDWDWPNSEGPKCVEGKIMQCIGEDEYLVSLKNPLILPDGVSLEKVIICGRHKGYPIKKIIPNCLRKKLILIHLASFPSVAVNVSTIDSKFFSIATVSQKI